MPLTPEELEWLLRELEAALRELWERLTPEQRRQLEERFLRVWSAIRDARNAGPAALAAAIQAIGDAMRGLIGRLARIGAPLEGLFGRLLGILGRFINLLGPAGAGAEGGAAGGAAVAGGVTVGAVLAVLFAVLAVIAAVISIYSEATTEVELPPGGVPCGLNSRDGIEMATIDRAITVRAIGTRTSLNKAIREAQALCVQDSQKCKGTCPAGSNCKPVVSVQSWEQWYRVFWTTTRIVFRCPCECVRP
ncbi:MAG: hypothetical protein HY083_11085 [Gammaproteobacteria bacterium]|nr:hypothetical protein [Gammaproteobacteria bacterium]